MPRISSKRICLALICCAAVSGLMTACGPAPTPTPMPTLVIIPSPTPPPFPTRAPRDVAAITKAIATSPYLDGKHAAKDMQCATCHTAMPPKEAPANQTCLQCHFGSYTALADKTKSVSPNPHKSHEGEIPCADCHRGHEAFFFKCGAPCHTEYSNNRFK